MPSNNPTPPVDIPRQLIVIQSTPFCNIDCKYCYLQSRQTTARIKPEILDRIFAQVFADSFYENPVHILWHAGEPLVVGVEFYETAYNLAERHARKHGRTFQFQIQTNATLIDQRWIEFFRQYAIKVGVSIDGPAFIHDANRVTRSGRGTYRQVMTGIRRLQEANIVFGALCVLTSLSLKYPKEMFEFFVGNGINSVGFNIEETEGGHLGLGATEDTLAQYRSFMHRLLALVDANPGKLRVREFDGMIGKLLYDGPMEVHNSTVTPRDILTFAYDGSYSTFCPELGHSISSRFGTFTMGNIQDTPINMLQRNPLFREVHKEVRRGLVACRTTCPYWLVCGGGQPSNKFFETGRFDVTETSQCRLHVQVLADVVLEFLEEKLSRLDQTQSN